MFLFYIPRSSPVPILSDVFVIALLHYKGGRGTRVNMPRVSVLEEGGSELWRALHASLFGFYYFIARELKFRVPATTMVATP